ncbi:MAG TPA: S8 family serine peptidase [Candidatus Limnocylindria bacterium]|nr:S8 family serine peptidase [Candidatus Limnocylindria bacterium]
MFRFLRLVWVGLWFLVVAYGQDSKLIRLRNGTIATPVPSRSALAAVANPNEPGTSGLFLLQFTNHVRPEWRDELARRGVELLHFVPDDAFVAHLDSAKLSGIHGLGFLRWSGPLEPGMKLHPRLTAAFATNLSTNLTVKLLLRPHATPVEIAAVVRTLRGPVTHHTLSTGTFVTGIADARRLAALAKSEAVIWIERVARMKMVDEVAAKIVGGDDGAVGTFNQVQQLGFDGRGVAVAVADSGLDSGDINNLHPDIAGRVDAMTAFGGLADARDEHSHGTHVSGIVAGNAASGEVDDNGQFWGLGVAPGAHLVVERIFDGAGDYFPPPSNAALTQYAVRNGAYVGSNSWGDDVAGEYNLDAAEFDALVRDADPDVPGEQPYVLEFSAGNAGPGPQTMDSPAVAKNVISTGATDNNRFGFGIYDEGQEVMADFSSRGPAEDGRIKPDITAPGTWISSLRSVYANDNNAWSPIDDLYLYQGGTSQAGPHASGACAVIVQWYRSTHGGATPSPALIKAMLINSADDMGTAFIPDPTDDSPDSGSVVGDTGPVPNNDEGWGRINLENLIAGPRRYQFVEQGTGLATDEVYEQRIVVGPDAQLKVSLVYTDVPGLPAAIPALVNDLDLEVVAPDGQIYRGNAFADGESTAGTLEGDRINNVEAVHLSVPPAGEYVVRVRANNVVQDVHHRAQGAPQQDFALVISGQLPLPGEGVVSWDRGAYRSPATAGVRLVDAQLAGQPTATVLVSSTAEPAGFEITLNRVGDSGTFTGSVPLVTGPAVAGDGQLSANDGDTLTVTYHDAAPVGDRVAMALVDNLPPVISSVVADARFGRASISWVTSEPATSLVVYGTTNAVTNLVTAVGLLSDHSVGLGALTPDETYFYYIVAADAAGNTATNNNGGFYFRFVAPRPAAALLVYSEESFLADSYPGIDTWTGTLDALTLNYEVWNVSQLGTVPKADDLKNYRLVLWRPEELGPPPAGLTDALTTYVQSGGSLFVSSFDLLSRLTEGGTTNFISEVLHVDSFQADTGASSLRAVPGEPVGGGIALDLNYDDFPDLLGIINWPDGPDSLSAGTNAAPTLLQESGLVVGVKYPKTGQDAVGRVVFNAFAFEAVPEAGDAPNNRATLLADAVRFLAPELVGGSSLAFDRSAYTVPSSAIVEATDSKRAGTGQVTVKLSSSSAPAPQMLTLFETARKGQFRGQFIVIPNVPGPLPNSSGPPRLSAGNGDLLQASYVDSGGTETTTRASVDTVAAMIADVAADPAYNEATISWTTSKPTDALVRYGESGGDDSFLTRSSYVAGQGTDHSVQLAGLLPDKQYYFQVVSRDSAGNVSTDNNLGHLYTFRTLKPLSPPWTDGLENGFAGWAVFDNSSADGFPDVGEDDGGDVSGSVWQFGAPAEAVGISAHSPTNCWATNLNGDSVDFSDTDLISPAITLIGGNQATLRFWQNYDFSGNSAGGEDDGFGDLLIEAGQVAVTTDNGGTWNDIYTVQSDASDGWEEVEVDLSHYVGHVVRLRFNYQLFSFNSVTRPGWLLDDFSVTLHTVASTVIVVSNNLAQATFTLAGPTNSVINGDGLVFRTNSVPGEYVVTWQPVPYYLPPASQTNTLGDSTNALVFTGTYTFPDANHNGISDLWEQQFFGAVTPGYSGQADVDGDGASDFAEWLAGTDPVSAASVLRLSRPEVQPNGTVRFEWPTVAGHSYELDVSTDLRTWKAVTTPNRAQGSSLEATLPALDPQLPYFFRVLVTP